MSEEAKKKEPVHCDEYVWGSKATFFDDEGKKALSWYLFVNRQPAVWQHELKQRLGGSPKLFADYKGNRVRVVMASRFGDVGITEDLKAENGYNDRVAVEELSNFSDEK